MGAIEDRWVVELDDGTKAKTPRHGVGKRYRARWRDPVTGAQRSRSFDLKRDAERHLVAVAHDVLTGRYVDPALGRTTFEEAARRYVERGAWRDRTRETARERLAPALARFGRREVASIKRGEVQAFVSSLELAPSTVKVVHQHLAAALAVAVDDGLIVANPARGVKLPRVDRAPVAPLEEGELEAMIGAAPAWFRPALVLGAGLGLRLGEAMGLTVDRIDFLRRTVRVDRQWQQPTGARPGAFAPPKTASSSRIVPASREVLDELAASIAERGTAGPEGFVVHRDGAPVPAPHVEYAMRKLRSAEGVRAGVKFHDLRHFYASLLISEGCSVKAVQSALGHASAAMTLDVYGHLFPGDEDRIRAATASRFARFAGS